jgi:oligopeptide transport system ATP-binding protein
MSKHLLEVKDLYVSFDTYAGEVQAVRGVDFTLDGGETLAIVGESGCGKSVTVQTIMKLNPEPPSRIKGGSILYRGEELINKTNREMQAYRGKEFSMIFQDSMTSLNPTMRVGRQISEAILKHRKMDRKEAKKLAVEMLAKVGLPNPDKCYRQYPHTLSGGMRQRVMIAMALSCEPAILLADEPTTALDVTTQAQILELMKEIKERTGTSIILITHNLGVVSRMADRIAIMYAGKIVERGLPDDIFYRPKHPYTWGLLGSMPDMSLRTDRKLTSIPGTPPDLFAPLEGCAFASRCPYCMHVCLKHEPPVFDMSEEHQSACWLIDSRAKMVVPPLGEDKTLRVKGRGGHVV